MRPHSNVKAVPCGHHHGVAHNSKGLANGREVPKILANYQSAQEGGLDYLRLLQFDIDAGKRIADTYSPSQDGSYHFEEGDDFIVDVALNTVG